MNVGPGKGAPRVALRSILITLSAAIAATACSTDGRGVAGPLPPVEDPPGFAHIHGLGVNPADRSLYAATHTGLYRIAGGRASIVANRYQDTMGFTIVGPDHFLASGHPDLREELPPLLGLLESRDAGETWERRSLLGTADFHVLRYAHDRIWGHDSTSSNLMVSTNGTAWDERSSSVMRDFVVSPGSEDVVLATNGEALRRSEDGGRTWEPSEAPRAPLLLDWHERSGLWLVTADGAVYRSMDSGGSWDRRGSIDGQPDAFLATKDRVYVAIHDEILASSDDGRTWRSFYPEE